MRYFRIGTMLVAAAFALAASSGAQTTRNTVTTADIQHLQDRVSDASQAIQQLQPKNGQLAAELQRDLSDARDDVTYLRVKLRKNEPISEREYRDLRDRLDGIVFRARDGLQPQAPPPPPAAPSSSGGGRWNPNATPATPALEPPPVQQPTAPDPETVPVGTQFDVRLQQPLSSATAKVEDRFTVTTMVDLKNGDNVLVPAGSEMRGLVTAVAKATRTQRTGSLQVAFDQVTIGETSYPIHATVTQALQSEGMRGEAGKIGAGAGIGAILGGILGGVKGALAGILIGGGGTIAATEGTDVNLAAGTVLRVRLDSPLTVARSN